MLPNLARRRPATLFVCLAFLISYGLGLPFQWLIAGFAPSDGHPLLLYPSRLFVVFGPFLSALTVAGLASGRSGIATLLAGLKPRRSDFAKSCLLVAYFVLVFVCAALVEGVPGPLLLEHLGNAPVLFLGHALLQVLIVGVGEETGWRGFLLPSLRRRYTPLTASLLVAAIWGIWHAPILFSGFRTTFFFLSGILGLSLLFTWITRHRGLPSAVVGHAAVNTPFFFYDPIFSDVPEAAKALQSAWYGAEAAYAVTGLVLVAARFRWWTSTDSAPDTGSDEQR